MSDILLNETSRDIDITEGQFSMTSGTAATKQRFQQAFSIFLAEWFLDEGRGIPYYEQVFRKNPNPIVLDAVFKNVILLDPATRELQRFSLDLDVALRELTLDFKVRTDDGVIEFSEILP